MEINICHLYPDLLNVYGDIGNILILKDRLIKRNINVNVINISTNDEFDESLYDIVLLGGGQDKEQSIVSEDLFKKKSQIRSYIENDKVLLTICGGYQLLGEYYVCADGEKLDGLNLVDIRTEKGDKRFIGNCVTKDICSNEFLIGFENHSGRTMLGDGVNPIGEVIVGFGNNGEDKTCGMQYKNTFGTYFHGSFLSKNPLFADRLIKTALENKYKEEIELEKLDDEFYFKARNILLNRFLAEK